MLRTSVGFLTCSTNKLERNLCGSTDLKWIAVSSFFQILVKLDGLIGLFLLEILLLEQKKPKLDGKF